MAILISSSSMRLPDLIKSLWRVEAYLSRVLGSTVLGSTNIEIPLLGIYNLPGPKVRNKFP